MNARLQKKTPNPAYCEVRDLYELFRARCGAAKSKTKKSGLVTRRKGRGKGKGNSKGNLEKGCTEPLKGIKTKCLIRIVPKTKRAKTFSLDRSCGCKSGTNAKTRKVRSS